MTNSHNKFGIYIHWPYCLSKCPYCDFYSEVRRDIPEQHIIEEYLSELDFYHNLTSEQTVTSIFFGGGTPSLIGPQNIEQLISHIHNKWSCANNLEISLEANPNTNHKNLFHSLKSAGINRLSLGVQALNDNDLKFLGRTHNTTQALNAIEEVLKTFDNHSMDLIYALPDQNISTWQTDLKQVTDLGFKHLSLYQLTIEENTSFFKLGVKPMEDDLATKIYELTTNTLTAKGYNRYEISNFSQPGFECKHNLTYWEGYDYIGIGKSAHGRIGLKATTHPFQIEELTPKERAEELVIMGLRLTEGINKARFKQICGLNFDTFINQKNLTQLEQQNLIISTNETIQATPTGTLILNHIIEKLLT